MALSALYSQFSKMPFSGLSAADLIDAINAFRSDPQIGNEPIVGVSARHDGHVLIKTGEMRGALSGGGLVVILLKNNGVWAIRETGNWAS